MCSSSSCFKTAHFLPSSPSILLCSSPVWTNTVNSCRVLTIYCSSYTHLEACKHTRARIYYGATGEYTHKSLQRVDLVQFYLLSVASKLIFAKGLTDITEFHLTYQDLIPVVFTLRCVSCSVYIEEKMGLGSEWLSCQPMFVFISPECWESTSARRCCVCLHVPNELSSITASHTHIHAYTLTAYKIISAHSHLFAQGSGKSAQDCILRWPSEGWLFAAATSVRTGIKQRNQVRVRVRMRLGWNFLLVGDWVNLG